MKIFGFILVFLLFSYVFCDVPNVSTITSSATASTSDIYRIDTSSNSVTLTLPSISTNADRRYVVKHLKGGINDAFIVASGSDTIDGDMSSLQIYEGRTYTLLANSANDNWIILFSYDP